MIVLLVLKIAVCAVTVMILSSLVYLWHGKIRIHGLINITATILTAITLFLFEGLIQFSNIPITSHFNTTDFQSLRVHLYFAVPILPIMLLMIWTGKRRRRSLHLMLAAVFAILWTGMFVTGVFYLPH